MLKSFLVTAGVALFATTLIGQELENTEFMTFWQTQGELDALNVYLESAEKSGLNLEVTLADDYNDLRATLAERISLDILPNFSHWLWGDDLVALNDSVDLIPLSKKIDGRSIDDIIYKEILPEITHNGEIIAIPVGIHLQTVQISNAELLKAAGYSEPPTTWEELFELADKLESNGQKAFALSNKAWHINDMFSGILVSIGQKEANLDLFDDNDKSGTLMASLEEAMEVFLKLRSYFGPEDVDSTWSGVVDRVVTGEAAIGFMGDFARSQALSHGDEAAQNMVCSPMPGELAAFFGVDVFVAFERAPNAQVNFEALQNAVLDPKIHSQYISLKGGLPILTDVDVSDLDQCGQNSLRIWNTDPEQRVSMSGRDHENAAKALHSLVTIWKNKNLSPKQAAESLYDAVIEDKTE